VVVLWSSCGATLLWSYCDTTVVLLWSSEGHLWWHCGDTDRCYSTSGRRRVVLWSVGVRVCVGRAVLCRRLVVLSHYDATVVFTVSLWWSLCGHCGATSGGMMWSLWCHSEVTVVASVVTVVASLRWLCHCGSFVLCPGGHCGASVITMLVVFVWRCAVVVCLFSRHVCCSGGSSVWCWSSSWSFVVEFGVLFRVYFLCHCVWCGESCWF